MSDRLKRNRNENYDQADIDLLLNLVQEHSDLIESAKQEDKKQGWGLVHNSFNTNCKGIQRDVMALRMKFKNLKAQNKRQSKGGEDRFPESLIEAEDGSQIMAEFTVLNKRKRTKMFTQEEHELLKSLVEKYSVCLDTSQTREAIVNRNSAWNNIVEEFNAANLFIPRDLYELKIKYKNMKSKLTNFNTDKSSDATMREDDDEIETSPQLIERKSTTTMNKVKKFSPRTHNNQPQTSTVKRPTIKASRRTNSEILNSIDDLDDMEEFTDDDIDDLEYIPPPPVIKRPKVHENLPFYEDKDEARIRKENLLLKNACLKKKERLLELQIALAERNLRRHQL